MLLRLNLAKLVVWRAGKHINSVAEGQLTTVSYGYRVYIDCDAIIFIFYLCVDRFHDVLCMLLPTLASGIYAFGI